MIAKKNRVHKCSLQNRHPLSFAAQGHICQRCKIPRGPQSSRMVPPRFSGSKGLPEEPVQRSQPGMIKAKGGGGGEAVPSKEKDEVKEGPVQCILLNNPHLPSLP